MLPSSAITEDHTRHSNQNYTWYILIVSLGGYMRFCCIVGSDYYRPPEYVFKPVLFAPFPNFRTIMVANISAVRREPTRENRAGFFFRIKNARPRTVRVRRKGGE